MRSSLDARQEPLEELADRAEIACQRVQLVADSTTSSAHDLGGRLFFGRALDLAQGQTMRVPVALESDDVRARQGGERVSFVPLSIPGQDDIVMLLQHGLGQSFTGRPITLLGHIGGKDFLQRILSHTRQAKPSEMATQFIAALGIVQASCDWPAQKAIQLSTGHSTLALPRYATVGGLVGDCGRERHGLSGGIVNG